MPELWTENGKYNELNLNIFQIYSTVQIKTEGN